LKLNSLKTQILLWFSGVTIFILIIFNTVFYYFLEQNIKLSIQNKFYDKAVYINDKIVANIPLDKLLTDKKLEAFDIAIVKDDKIIYKKINKVTSTNDPTAHGEIVAIRDACKNLNNFDLKNCDLYTSCEPCPMCLSAIYWSRIDKVYYANTRDDAQKIDFDDSLIYSELSKNVKERNIPMHQIMREEALKAFELWDKKTDKVKY